MCRHNANQGLETMTRFAEAFRMGALLLGVMVSIASTSAGASEPCGTGSYPFPYTDVASVTDPFCPGIMEAYVTGVSKGTTPTTFSPNDPVIRLQMTTFLQRSLDQGLARASRRGALNQWWTPQTTNAMQTIKMPGGTSLFCTADGEHIWVAGSSSPTTGNVSEVEANTGAVLATWTGAQLPQAMVVAAGKVFVAGDTTPGSLYVIDPTLAPGAVTVAASNLGGNSEGIAFDGTNIWTANLGGSVSIITPQASTPYPVTTVSTGFSQPYGMIYDGSHIWVTDLGAGGVLFKLDAAGAILQTVTVGRTPAFPAFDGTNIWVPNNASNSVTVVQASTGNVVATIAADANNLLDQPNAVAFDGERMLVTNFAGNTVSVFKAADLSFIANVSTGAVSEPFFGCSDGINFWVTVIGDGALSRF
jgi:hypothetical protein